MVPRFSLAPPCLCARRYERLIYLQAADEVILGNIPIDDEETVAKLVCDSMIVDLEAEMPEDPETLLECSMIECVVGCRVCMLGKVGGC